MRGACGRRRAQSGKEDSKAGDDFNTLAAQSASRSGMPSRLAFCGFPRLFAFAFSGLVVLSFSFLNAFPHSLSPPTVYFRRA
jgi:hypothetical protein